MLVSADSAHTHTHTHTHPVAVCVYDAVGLLQRVDTASDQAEAYTPARARQATVGYRATYQ